MAENEHQLIVRKGPNPGDAYPLTADTVVIGRGPTNDIVIEDAEVSRQHARLTRTAEGYALQDLGSTNGTFLDGKRLGQDVVDLHAGQVIMVGTNVTLVYEAPAAADPMATVIAPEPAVQALEEEVLEEPEVLVEALDEFEAPGLDEPLADLAEEELPEPPAFEPMASLEDELPVADLEEAVAEVEEEMAEVEPIDLPLPEEAAPDLEIAPPAMEAAEMAAPELPDEEEPELATILDEPFTPPVVEEPIEPILEAVPEPEPPAPEFPEPTPLPSFPETELEAEEAFDRTVVDSAAPMPEFEAEAPSRMPPVEEPEKKSNRRNIIIIAAVVIVLCCCLAIVAAVILIGPSIEEVFDDISRELQLVPLPWSLLW